MDWAAVDDTFPLWAEAVAGLVQRQRAASSNLAAAYISAVRYASGLTDAPPIVLAPPVEAERLNTSLTVTAAVSIKANAARGMVAEQAMKNAFVRSAGAVSRLVLEGGQDTVRLTVAADPKAKGWQRVASGNACSFCSMLAGRGDVYKESTASFESHDHCSCQAEPVY
jgi:hypothetical protein